MGNNKEWRVTKSKLLKFEIIAIEKLRTGVLPPTPLQLWMYIMFRAKEHQVSGYRCSPSLSFSALQTFLQFYLPPPKFIQSI